jgi:hypothetical protein
MQVGDLVRNRATGRMFVVTGIGTEDAKKWITVFHPWHPNTVYHAEYFEVVSPKKGGENDE